MPVVRISPNGDLLAAGGSHGAEILENWIEDHSLS
jgi:hypothetical protein